MSNVTKASFNLGKFFFSYTNIDVANFSNDEDEVDIKFNPSGEYFSDDNRFELTLEFKAYYGEENIDKPYVLVKLRAIFQFSDGVESFDELPEYFYKNSIAILYPYIRSYVSTLTLQAGLNLLVLPTMNVSSLGELLKERTTSR